MIKPKYPLIEKCFPDLRIDSCGHISPEDLESALEKAVRVFGVKYENGFFMGEKKDSDDTHTALLLGPEPIVKDTAESLLKELVDLMDGPELLSKHPADLRNRAKRLLRDLRLNRGSETDRTSDELEPERELEREREIMSLKQKILARARQVCREDGCAVDAEALIEKLAAVCDASSQLIEHYAEQKAEVEAHRLRTVHLSSEKMLVIHDALSALRAEVGE